MEKLVLIQRPIKEVFEYVADCRNSKGYLGKSFHFEALTPPPFGVGTKAVAIGQFLQFGIRLNYTMTEFRPNQLIRLQAPNQSLNGVMVDSEALWRFQERGPDRTLASFRLVIEPRADLINPFALLISRPLISSAEMAVGGMLDSAMQRLKMTLERVPQKVA